MGKGSKKGKVFSDSWKVKQKNRWPHKKYFCKDCNKEISRFSGVYGEGRCPGCARKIDWAKPSYRFKKMQDMNGFKKGPNKPEKFLIDFLDLILPKQYNYVGDLLFWVDKFNPDFVNVKRNKIIEFFGEYWHNRPEIILRDELRLKTYKANGYDTLVLFQTDLDNYAILEKKIKEFNDK